MEIFNLRSLPWHSNCYLLCDTDVGAGVVIDPSEDAMRVVSFAKSRGVEIVQILLTHGHFDHMLSLDALRTITGAPLAVHAYDVECLGDSHKSAFDLLGEDRVLRAPEIELCDGSIIEFGKHKIKVLHTPGHTKGSCCFAVCDSLFTGDTLFVDGYGRCDLYGGNHTQMMHSLHRLALSETDYKIFPGHGESGRLKEVLENII